jgi:hypothetical protein
VEARRRTAAPSSTHASIGGLNIRGGATGCVRAKARLTFQRLLLWFSYYGEIRSGRRASHGMRRGLDGPAGAAVRAVKDMAEPFL